LNMALGFRASTNEVLAHSNVTVRVGQISIQRQRPLALSNAESNSVRLHLHSA
jgi:hypothetical protein